MLEPCFNCGAACLPGDVLRDELRAETNLLDDEGFTHENLVRYVNKLEDIVSADRIGRHKSCRSSASDWVHAEHEAAHAVIGMAFGLTVKQVNIDTTVCCTFEPGQIRPLDRALVYLAGPATARRRQRHRLVEVASLRVCAVLARSGKHRPCDHCNAMKHISVAYPDASDDEWIETFERTEDQALGMVRAHSMSIELVAQSLIAAGHLTGKQIAALLTQRQKPNETPPRLGPSPEPTAGRWRRRPVKLASGPKTYATEPCNRSGE